MSAHEKLKRRINGRTIPDDIPFSKIEAFLLKEGFTKKSGKGDHVKFSHPKLRYHISVDRCKKGVAFYAIEDIKIALEYLEQMKQSEN